MVLFHILTNCLNHANLCFGGLFILDLLMNRMLEIVQTDDIKPMCTIWISISKSFHMHNVSPLFENEISLHVVMLLFYCLVNNN